MVCCCAVVCVKGEIDDALAAQAIGFMSQEGVLCVCACVCVCVYIHTNWYKQATVVDLKGFLL